MKCANCGMELSPSSKTCIRCGSMIEKAFNYQNMEKELLNTVMEDEDMAGMPEKSLLYQENSLSDDDLEEPEGEPEKQWGKLAVSLLLCGVLLAGGVFGLQRFPTEYTYGKTEAEYRNCLDLMAKQDYTNALASVDLLLEEDGDNLAYLALKNTICTKSGDEKAQISVLNKIIEQDVDNYQAYEQLLQLYLTKDNQAKISKLAAEAPNKIIASMLRSYLVEAPYLELTPGVYDTGQTLAISSESGYAIYYTLDGSSPEKEGILYQEPLFLEQGHYTVTAVCRNEHGVYGQEESGEYQIGISTDSGNMSNPSTDGSSDTSQITGNENSDYGSQGDSASPVGQPAVYPDSGTYTTPQRIVIDVPIGDKAYYSWSLGASLTPENGTLYTGGITMPEGSSVLSVILADANGNTSTVKQVSYQYQP